MVIDSLILLCVGSALRFLDTQDQTINRAVKRAIDMGSLCTLNNTLEVSLANKLVSLHPWSSQVKVARTGGEADAIAIRITRAATGRSRIAISGYHGWHDWYLSANLGSVQSLDNHLLPWTTLRIPRQLSGLTNTFEYGDATSLENLLVQGDYAAIVLEPARGESIDIKFLNEVRELANKYQCILIFDEITSGFREVLGGIHLMCDVYPDIVLFGKAMSNGVPMSAIVGKSSVMNFASKTFISSTYWTDSIDPAAALCYYR